VKVNFSKETFPTPIRIGLLSLFSCQPFFILKMQVLLQCSSLATAAKDQFSASERDVAFKKNSFNKFFIASVKL
jgi:hypothetical protein